MNSRNIKPVAFVGILNDPEEALTTTNPELKEGIEAVLNAIGSEQDDVSGAVMPTGGKGLRGWMSAIWLTITTQIAQKLPPLTNNRIPVEIDFSSFPANSNSTTEITNDVGNPIPVSGNVNIANFPITQQITGTVAINNNQLEISNDAGNPVPISGGVSVTNFPTTQQITGSVAISNSQIEIANDTGNPVPVSGSVNVANFPATQQIAGVVAISNNTTKISNDTNNPVPVTGSVNVANFPTTQQITGAVSISNSQIEITNDVGSPVPVAGSVNISNLPATQQIAGTVAISDNSQLTQITQALTQAQQAQQPQQQSANYRIITNSTTIAVGAKRVFIANIGQAPGVVLSSSLPAGIAIPFEATGNNTLSAISVDGTNTQLAVVEIR